MFLHFQMGTFVRHTNSFFLLLAILGGNAMASDAFSKADVCKAAISSEMGRSVKTMKTLKSAPDMPEVIYARDDGNKYRYQCRFNGNRVVWRTYFNDHLKTGWGRWRDTDPNDSVLTYRDFGHRLELHNSSTGTTDRFEKHNF